MAGKICFKTIKKRLIALLTIVMLLCFSMFGLIACGQSESKDYNDDSYSYTVEDDALIKNQNFSYLPDYKDADADDYPLTSPTGWSKSTDNASASNINSGTVSVTEDDWKTLLGNLYDNTTFLNYLKDEYNFQVIDVKEYLNAEEPDNVSSSDIKNYVIEHLLLGNDFLGRTDCGGNFAYPKTHKDSTDNFVYMLNNYMSTVRKTGTAQKVTSSSTVTLEANKIYKLSVWVKVLYVASNNPDGDFGATIRLSNNFNGVSQAEYRVTNIKNNVTDTDNNDWNQYSIYIKTDKDVSGSFTLSLGLGLGLKNSNSTYYTEGTVLFDDITVTEETSVPSDVVNANMVYGSSENIDLKVNDTGTLNYSYDMAISNSIGTTSNNVTFSHELTKSNIKDGSGNYITSEYFDNTSSIDFSEPDADGIRTLTLNKSSATINVTSSDFVLSNAGHTQYAAITFYVKSNLNKLSSTSITIDVYDILAGKTVKRAAVATLTPEDGEWTKCTILVKNNFEGIERKFSLAIVVGPNDLSSVSYSSDFANGSVCFKDFSYVIKDIDKDSYVTAEYEDGSDNPEYKLLSMFEKSASATTALYAGYEEDYTDPSGNSTSYNISSSPSGIGEITSNPASAKDYEGIVADHVYVKETSVNDSLETSINDRIGNGTAKGNAGLINTKYISSYTNSAAITAALAGAYTDDIQPLMIYNKVADSYGFIGTTKNISSDSYAMVTTNIRVVGDAVAYVYLVDTDSKEKNVLDFATFEVNTDIVDGIAVGTKINAEDNKLYLKVDSSMMDADGWVTLTFCVATGEDAINFRFEVWNGGRDGSEANKSEGFVFVKNINITTYDAFSLPERWADAFSSSSSILFNVSRDDLKLIAYQRELNEDEIEYNKQYPDSAISYQPNYVWASNSKFILASLNSIDPVYNNPFDDIEDSTDEAGSGCTAETDPSTFWLSFSSILLGVVLILAIIALFIKNIRRRRSYNAADDKGNFKIQSKAKTHKNNMKRIERQAEANTDEETKETDIEETSSENDFNEEPEEIISDEVKEEVKPEDQDLDSYVYGEVQDFGENEKNDN